MNAKQLLSDDEAIWISSYQAQVVTTFTSRFCESGDRFVGWQRLIDPFSAAVETVRRQGRSKFRAVDEAHNELYIAHAILSNRSPTFGRVEYEPALFGTARSIDFRCAADPDLTVYVDVKTIKPEARDRWEQYERAVCKKLLPEHARITLLKEGLGGELWHYMFAARSKMLNYAVGLERKIADAKLAGTGALLILVFCGEGFYWHEDELEDFVKRLIPERPGHNMW